MARERKRSGKKKVEKGKAAQRKKAARTTGRSSEQKQQKKQQRHPPAVLGASKEKEKEKTTATAGQGKALSLREETSTVTTPEAPRPGERRAMRVEADTLGEVEVPAEAYWGVQTQRALENFPVSGRRAHVELVRAYVAVKKACASANMALGKLDENRGRLIGRACDEVLGRGLLLDQWVVDVFQAGAGTSFNMNTNEVLANRGLELMGKPRGEYQHLSPHDHVNMSQSTNDTFPTAMHVAALALWRQLRPALRRLESVLVTKGRLFDKTVKSGRTHLQDAVPVRLGQEFTAYAGAVREATARLESAAAGLQEVALGGSAVGTGLNTHEKFAATAVEALGKLTNLPLAPAKDLRLRMQSMGPVAALSGALRNLALELIRIANDLRLMGSGPRTGLAEINLPAAQPGSSIMPGKVNPSLAECLNMICFQVVGNDTVVALAVQAGQLELNVMMPVMATAVLDSMEYLKNFLPVFGERCVEGITVNEERCRAYFEGSVGLATILNQRIGYQKAAALAKKSVATGRSVVDLIREEGLLSEQELAALLAVRTVTEPGTTTGAARAGDHNR
jgi:aspartate ammonia-lyase